MRFQPDTWLDAVLRPVAMAAADSNVYVELMAPDFRFVFALGLLVVLALLWPLRRRRADVDRAGMRAVFLLLCALAVAFVPWLATTGNGRYFVAGLLAIGPVCVGLARLLPATRALRLTLVAGMVALQAFAVQQSAPWHAWGLAAWTQPPYFEVELPRDVREQPATYVTMSAISYSLLAPLFHPQSRWMSLHHAVAPGAPQGHLTEKFLGGPHPGPLMLLVPVVPGTLTPHKLPDANVSAAIGAQLAPYRLAFAQPQSCRFLWSRSLAGMGLGEKSEQERARSGFWLCELTRLPPAAPGEQRRPTRHDAVFGVIEKQCPRFFPSGGDHGSLVLPDGEARSYVQGEMKAYVYDSGEVYYKYYRALNPVLVGRAEDLLAGRARLDCGRIRGRSGLPWEREI